jgi:beta-lactam-binding protein with PASTA domain
MGCMKDRGEATICPHCGYEEGTPQYASYLPPRTMIGNRYLVGRVLNYNGEGVLYIGFDTMNQRRVDIREYFPDTLVSRDSDGKTVRVTEGRQIAFKANMGDYIEMMQKLTRLRTISCLVQVYGLLEENQTVYAIREHLEAISLREYLVRKGTMLSWQEAADLLMPAVKTLRLLHQDGILHRGLSADTLFVTPQGTIKIGGFSISAVRAARTELAAELFPGYSAPEQYSPVSPHGPWTDVYGICALFYTALTGQRPPEALIRSEDKQLMSPRERNETVPPYVSEALLKGLSLNIQQRIQDMDALLAVLTGIPVAQEQDAAVKKEDPEPVRVEPIRRPSYRKNEEKTAYYHPAPSHSKTHLKEEEKIDPQEEGRAAERRRTRKLVMNSMLIALPILLLALILTFWLLFGGRNQETEKNPSESSDTIVASDEWLVSSYAESSHSSNNTETRPNSESSQDDNSRPESSRKESSEESKSETYQMENFVGQKYADVVADAKNREIYLFADPEYRYSDEQPEGYIIDQDVTAGLEISKGTRVTLTVSKGSQKIQLPAYEKQTEQAYLTKLDALGVPYRVVYKTDSDYPAGYVVGTSASDNQYDLSSGVPLDVYVSMDS